jgi:adenylate kinase
MLILMLLGPPAAGKGTQAARLSSDLGLAHLSPGAILRDQVELGSELGLKVGGYLDRGELVPDELVNEMMLGALAGKQGFLLDGYPRNVAQAETLTRNLDARGEALSRVVLIEVPEDVAVERMAGRGRGDDNPETFRARLRTYHESTEPLIDYYEQRGLLRRVDGSGNEDEVHAAIQAALA